MPSEPTFSVALPAEGSLEELVAIAREAERLGYRTVWVNDDRLQKDVFTVLAAVGLATDRIGLGPGVTNPYSRHPALIATAIATLDELSDGRAVLGLGAGGTNHRMLGIAREAPAAALREAIDLIRRLLAGGEVTLTGRVVRAQEAKLDFKPLRADVPIAIGARGPRMLELAGEVADQVIVGNVATGEGWSYALERVDAGAERAGRRLGDLRLTAWLYCCVTDAVQRARDAVRPMVATSLVTSRPVLHELGIVMPKEFAEAMDGMAWSLSREAVTRAAPAVPDEVVGRFALAGTPRECRARLAELLESSPQIAEVAIVPFPAVGERRVDVVRRFVEEVASELVLRRAATG
ncbi:MAG: LLM class flavin-dependent oxidoreductase, partial [Gaiellaceae bacterium]